MPIPKPRRERIRARKVVEITSLSLRQVQEMSARGLIPSAAKLGSVWTYNEAAIRKWVREAEEENVRQAMASEQAFRRISARPPIAWPEHDAAYYRKTYDEAMGTRNRKRKRGSKPQR